MKGDNMRTTDDFMRGLSEKAGPQGTVLPYNKVPCSSVAVLDDYLESVKSGYAELKGWFERREKARKAVQKTKCKNNVEASMLGG